MMPDGNTDLCKQYRTMETITPWIKTQKFNLYIPLKDNNLNKNNNNVLWGL